MSEQKTGGSAFPVPGLQADETFNGMTLRDYFAAKAMQILLHDMSAPDPESVAEWAYKHADAMLQARENNVP